MAAFTEQCEMLRKRLSRRNCKRNGRHRNFRRFSIAPHDRVPPTHVHACYLSPRRIRDTSEVLFLWRVTRVQQHRALNVIAASAIDEVRIRGQLYPARIAGEVITLLTHRQDQRNTSGANRAPPQMLVACSSANAFERSSHAIARRVDHTRSRWKHKPE